MPLLERESASARARENRDWFNICNSCLHTRIATTMHRRMPSRRVLILHAPSQISYLRCEAAGWRRGEAARPRIAHEAAWYGDWSVKALPAAEKARTGETHCSSAATRSHTLSVTAMCHSPIPLILLRRLHRSRSRPCSPGEGNELISVYIAHF